MPAATSTKPGSATLPFFGVELAIIDAEGREFEGPGEGNLVQIFARDTTYYCNFIYIGV